MRAVGLVRSFMAAVALTAGAGSLWGMPQSQSQPQPRPQPAPVSAPAPASAPVKAPVAVVAVVSAAWIDTARGGPALDTAAMIRKQCTDTAYRLEPWKVGGGYDWSYNPAGAPAAVARSAASAIDSATRALVSGRNDCGWTRPFRVAARYLGPTRATVGVSAAGRCTADDGRSVTGWKRLSGDALAITCTYYHPDTGRVASSDVAINNRYRWFVARPPGCAGRFDLMGVLTHERGHTFGLSHVSSVRHPGQTMQASIAECSVAERTLGGGDHAGMRRIYGTR